ncbi:MAG: acyl-CoA thioesterase [Myxococcales bacterium]|nr:acyl-CoA thioesterase [Myxococcales bacterium]
MTTPDGVGVHVHRQPVRFGDCDPAGIVYYPRFLHFFHETMETWFLEALDYPYDRVILGRQIGFPSVHCHADFRVPCKMGDVLAIELRVLRLGRSSIHFDYRVRGEGDPPGEPRLTGGTVCVVMDLDPRSANVRRSLPIPPGLRGRIEAFMAGAAIPRGAADEVDAADAALAAEAGAARAGEGA